MEQILGVLPIIMISSIITDSENIRWSTLELTVSNGSTIQHFNFSTSDLGSSVGGWHVLPWQTYTVASPFAGSVLEKSSTAPVFPSTILFG